MNVTENTVNIIAEGTLLEGKIRFEHVSRVHGILKGSVVAAPGSTLILAETAWVEGTIDADVLTIDGYVKGDIRARTKVVVSATGRVVGNISSPSLILEFGCFFEGRSSVESAESIPSKP